MPTYTVTVANLSLSPQQKSEIAEAITTAHHTQTGAPQVYVHGLVRQGLSTEVKQALMSQMLEKIVRIAGITVEDVWIYLQDIPATQMIEFGRFLPAPGDEAEWEWEMTPEKQSTLSD